MKKLKVAAAALAVWLLPMLAAAQINNAQLSVMPATAQTAATVNSADQVNTYYRGVHIVVTVTGYVSGNYTVTLQGKNSLTGTYYPLLVGPAIAGNGVTILKLYPGAAAVANGAASDFLPLNWRVQLSGAATPSMTVAVDAMMAGG